jgi:hypothetical protein
MVAADCAGTRLEAAGGYVRIGRMPQVILKGVSEAAVAHDVDSADN